jgi:hypothetical protein
VFTTQIKKENSVEDKDAFIVKDERIASGKDTPRKDGKRKQPGVSIEMVNKYKRPLNKRVAGKRSAKRFGR